MRNMELLFVKDMFNTIAPWYDFLNRFLSLGQDIYWRREMVTALKISNSSKTIDIACGTCDVAIEIIKQKGKNAKVIGVDFSPGMLAPGLKKIINGKLESNIFLAAGNALSLPVTKKSFDGVSIAFGIRNIKDRTKALQEFYASLKTGGKIAIIVGDSTVNGRKIPTTILTKKFCEEVGFKFNKLIFNPLLGARNRAIRGESIIICTKP